MRVIGPAALPILLATNRHSICGVVSYHPGHLLPPNTFPSTHFRLVGIGGQMDSENNLTIPAFMNQLVVCLV